MQDKSTGTSKGKPLTKRELHALARERVSLISKEFTEGFRFLENFPRSVTFFGSAKVTEDTPYYIQARSLAGKIVTELKYSVLSGGGPGIMEAANRGAFENGGESLGLTIELPSEQTSNPYITKSIDFFYFFSRKVCLSFSAEAYIFFPGGYGTFDEVFEILTLVQTHKIEPVPIILVGKEYWTSMEEWMKKEMLSRGMIDTHDMNLYTITDDEDEIVDIIRKVPVHNGVPLNVGTLPSYEQDIDRDVKELAHKKCVPCEGNEKPLAHNASEDLLDHVNQWTMVDDISIEKTLHVKDFTAVIELVNKVADIAEEQGHHPDIHIYDYNKVRFVLSTHAIKGLSENDFIMAAKIDELLR